MKLSEFKNVQKEVDKKNTNNGKVNETKVDNKKIEDAYNTYKNMNQNELMEELINQVSKQKQDGTFNYQQINNSVQQLMPFLNDEQKNNLLSILQKIK